MPGIVFPNQGQNELANYMLSQTCPQTQEFLVDLYQNDYSPGQSSTITDFVICDFPGYCQVIIKRSQWLAAVEITNKAFVNYVSNPITWNNNGSETMVWGFLVRSQATGVVLWCQQFDGGVMIPLGKSLQLPMSLLLFGQNQS